MEGRKIEKSITQKDKEKLEELDSELELGTMSDEALAIVAKIAGIPFDLAKKAQKAYMIARDPFSFDMELKNEDFRSSTKHETYLDTFSPEESIDPDIFCTPTLEEQVEKQEQRKLLMGMIHSLPPREAKVLMMRYGFEDGEPRTLEAIGEKYGITRERVRQIEANALGKLRKMVKRGLFKDII